MSFLAPALPALIGAGGSLLGGLLGGSGKKAPTVNYTPPGFNAGGLSATFGGGGYNVTPSADRTAAVGGLADTFGAQATDIAGLRSQWTPGASNLRQSLMQQLQSQRSSAIGNLRDNLARRRILGSSFAQDSLARADQEYQQNIQTIQAQTFLQELQAQQQLNQQQYTAARGQFQTSLDEMNLEASVAQSLTSKASDTLASVAKTQAELDAKAKAGAGQFFGNIGTQFGRAIGGMFGGGGTAAAGTDLALSGADNAGWLAPLAAGAFI